MSANNINVGASGSGSHEGGVNLEEDVNGSGAVDGAQPADQVARQMQGLEVGDIPSLTTEEKKAIDELLAQVKDSMKDNKDSNQGAYLPAESTQVKGKSLDLSIKTAVQMAVRIFKTENSSLNAELSNKINVVSNNLDTLKEKVDGHDNEIAAADKKAQDALDKISEIEEKLKDVDLKLGTLDEAIKNKVPVNLSEAQMTSIKQEVWKVVSADNAKQRIAKHKLMGCIFNLESTPYDWRLKPRQLFFSIVEEAGCADLFPQYQVTQGRHERKKIQVHSHQR